jgi:vacuolar-type H+-ATPase subunit I/STV1
MSDDKEQIITELDIDSDDTESATADGKSADNAEQTEEDLSLKITKETSDDERKIQAQKQADTWTRRIINGEADINSLPTNLTWLKPLIQEKLNALNKAPVIEELVKNEFQKQEDKRRFSEMTNVLKSIKKTPQQVEILKSTWKFLVEERGLLPSEALDLAIAKAGISMETEGIDLILKKRMALPKQSDRSTEPDETPITDENFSDKRNKMSNKERMAMYKKMGMEE